MSIMSCTSSCVYQIDGCCTMERAGSGGALSPETKCAHYVAKPVTPAGRRAVSYPSQG